jgi:hypothetical protein
VSSMPASFAVSSVTTRTPSQAGSFLVASPRSVQCGGPDAMGA